MKIGSATVTIFKIKNRRGYAAMCRGNLTEGATREQAFDRMTKAVRRTGRTSKA
jgi:hypothetical protein